MINKIHIKELLSWIVVILSIILFSATVALSQEKSVNVKRSGDKVHIEVKSSENGKTISKDTTFMANDDTDVEKVISDFTGEKNKKDNKAVIVIKEKDGKEVKKNKIMVDVDMKNISQKDKERINREIEKAMKGMRKGLKEMQKSLEEMDIHIDEDLDDIEFSFDSSNDQDFEIFEKHLDDEFDSMTDKEHVVIVGDEDEKPPVLEKVINKNGKQVFVYKRVNPNVVKKSASQWIQDFECFPNPTTGKITVRFKSQSTNNLSLNIVDEKGKVVFTEKLNDFSGSFSKEINLSEKGKGNFLLTISDSENSMTKKIVIN